MSWVLRSLLTTRPGLVLTFLLVGSTVWIQQNWTQADADRLAGAVTTSICTRQPRPAVCVDRPAAQAPAQLQQLTRQAPMGGYDRASWARELLVLLGVPVSASNQHAVVAWEIAEGGHWGNSARYNPLNTTQRMAGSWSMNSVGVQAYTSWAQGLMATRATLTNGRYGGIVTALRAGACAACVAAAVGASPWGTGRFSV